MIWRPAGLFGERELFHHADEDKDPSDAKGEEAKVPA